MPIVRHWQDYTVAEILNRLFGSDWGVNASDSILFSDSYKPGVKKYTIMASYHRFMYYNIGSYPVVTIDSNEVITSIIQPRQYNMTDSKTHNVIPEHIVTHQYYLKVADGYWWDWKQIYEYMGFKISPNVDIK